MSVKRCLVNAGFIGLIVVCALALAGCIEPASMDPAQGFPGTRVTIQGSGFGENQGLASVNFGGVPASEYMSWDDSTIVTKVPVGAQSGDVLIIDGAEKVSAGYFTVLSLEGNEDPRDLVCHYPFDEGEGIGTRDLADVPNDGRLINAAWVEDSQGAPDSHALEFNGADSYVEVPRDDTLNQFRDVEINARVFIPSDLEDGFYTVLSKYNFSLCYVKIDGWELPLFWNVVVEEDEESHLEALAVDGVPLDSWFDLAASYDQTTSRVSVNGEVAGELRFDRRRPLFYDNGDDLKSSFYMGCFGDFELNHKMKYVHVDELELPQGQFEIDTPIEPLEWDLDPQHPGYGHLSKPLRDSEEKSRSADEEEYFFRGMLDEVKLYRMNQVYVDSISPKAVPVGAEVTITGDNFGGQQGESKVTFNGIEAGDATHWSPDEIRAEVPERSRTGPVVVTVAGSSSEPVDFTVISESPLPGKLGHWTFNEGDGQVIYDVSGVGNSASFSGQWVDRASDVDDAWWAEVGGGSMVEIPHHDSFEELPRFTLKARIDIPEFSFSSDKEFKIAEKPGAFRLYARTSGDPENQSCHLCFDVLDEIGEHHVESGLVDLGNDPEITAVYDSTIANNGMKVYLDGEMVAERVGVWGVVGFAGEPITLGGRLSTDPQFYVTDFRLFAFPRAPISILSLSEEHAPPSTLIEIVGIGFCQVEEDNRVLIAGAEATVVWSAPESIFVLVPVVEDGPTELSVTVWGETDTVEFTVDPFDVPKQTERGHYREFEVLVERVLKMIDDPAYEDMHGEIAYALAWINYLKAQEITSIETALDKHVSSSRVNVYLEGVLAEETAETANQALGLSGKIFGKCAEVAETEQLTDAAIAMREIAASLKRVSQYYLATDKVNPTVSHESLDPNDVFYVGNPNAWLIVNAQDFETGVWKIFFEVSVGGENILTKVESPIIFSQPNMKVGAKVSFAIPTRYDAGDELVVDYWAVDFAKRESEPGKFKFDIVEKDVPPRLNSLFLEPDTVSKPDDVADITATVSFEDPNSDIETIVMTLEDKETGADCHWEGNFYECFEIIEGEECGGIAKGPLILPGWTPSVGFLQSGHKYIAWAVLNDSQENPSVIQGDQFQISQSEPPIISNLQILVSGEGPLEDADDPVDLMSLYARFNYSDPNRDITRLKFRFTGDPVIGGVSLDFGLDPGLFNQSDGEAMVYLETGLELDDIFYTGVAGEIEVAVWLIDSGEGESTKALYSFDYTYPRPRLLSFAIVDEDGNLVTKVDDPSDLSGLYGRVEYSDNDDNLEAGRLQFIGDPVENTGDISWEIELEGPSGVATAPLPYVYDSDDWCLANKTVDVYVEICDTQDNYSDTETEQFTWDLGKPRVLSGVDLEDDNGNYFTEAASFEDLSCLNVDFNYRDWGADIDNAEVYVYGDSDLVEYSGPFDRTAMQLGISGSSGHVQERLLSDQQVGQAFNENFESSTSVMVTLRLYDDRGYYSGLEIAAFTVDFTPPESPKLSDFDLKTSSGEHLDHVYTASELNNIYAEIDYEDPDEDIEYVWLEFEGDCITTYPDPYTLRVPASRFGISGAEGTGSGKMLTTSEANQIYDSDDWDRARKTVTVRCELEDETEECSEQRSDNFTWDLGEPHMPNGINVTVPDIDFFSHLIDNWKVDFDFTDMGADIGGLNVWVFSLEDPQVIKNSGPYWRSASNFDSDLVGDQEGWAKGHVLTEDQILDAFDFYHAADNVTVYVRVELVDQMGYRSDYQTDSFSYDTPRLWYQFTVGDCGEYADDIFRVWHDGYQYTPDTPLGGTWTWWYFAVPGSMHNIQVQCLADTEVYPGTCYIGLWAGAHFETGGVELFMDLDQGEVSEVVNYYAPDISKGLRELPSGIDEKQIIEPSKGKMESNAPQEFVADPGSPKPSEGREKRRKPWLPMLPQRERYDS